LKSQSNLGRNWWEVLCSNLVKDAPLGAISWWTFVIFCLLVCVVSFGFLPKIVQYSITH
jgi:uncharacterized membrane protein YczE